MSFINQKETLVFTSLIYEKKIENSFGFVLGVCFNSFLVKLYRTILYITFTFLLNTVNSSFICSISWIDVRSLGFLKSL